MMADACCRLVILLLLMVSMGAIIVAMMTDYWFDVEDDGILLTSEQRKMNNYRFGFWRRCYAERPESFPNRNDVDESGDRCIWIYKDLIPKDEEDLPSDEKLRLHLMRSAVGLSITSAAVILFAIISLLCFWVPGRCKTPQKALTHTITLIIVVFAFMAAIASGICFMAARDVEDRDLHMYPDRSLHYLWSFMLHWCGTGLILVTSCVLLYQVAHSYKDVSNKSHYYYYSYY